VNNSDLKIFKRRVKRWLWMEPARKGTVISFPKSGRTWLRVMLDHLEISMDYTHAGSEYAVGCHFADLPCPSSNVGLGRQFFLFRDPRDTAVSGYFQKIKRKRHTDFEGGIAEFIRDPRYGVEKVIRFNLAWLEFYMDLGDDMHRGMSYERLRESPVQSLAALYRYLAGRDPAAWELLEDVVEKTSFSKMQAQERSGELGVKYGSILTPADVSDPESMKVRKGKVGGFVDYMSDDDIAFCDELLSRLRYQERLNGCAPVLLLPAG
jgi:hypothetical protein